MQLEPLCARKFDLNVEYLRSSFTTAQVRLQTGSNLFEGGIRGMYAGVGASAAFRLLHGEPTSPVLFGTIACVASFSAQSIGSRLLGLKESFARHIFFRCYLHASLRGLQA